MFDTLDDLSSRDVHVQPLLAPQIEMFYCICFSFIDNSFNTRIAA
jgi:hypothetical protein